MMDPKRSVLLAMIFIGIRGSMAQRRSRMRLDPTSRGYVDMVVAIDDRLNETQFPLLLESIKDAFTKASASLHIATRFLTYFKEIRILVPKTWTTAVDYEEATWETFAKSDVRIDNNQITSAPHVLQPEQCGTPGHYMALTPNYVITEDIYGPIDKIIVHEFGHLRYGLFDEYPLYGSSTYYLNPSTEEIEATRCVAAITGNFVNVNSDNTENCFTYDRNGFLVSGNCQFYDNHDGPYRASLMYKPFLNGISDFCDDSSLSQTKHNKDAPNRQNLLCDYKSAWEVMREHADFIGTDGLDPIPRSNTTPNFVLVQEKMNVSIVLVLDISGSMSSTPQRLQILRQASRHLIRNAIPQGSTVGIVGFNQTAHTLIPLSQIKSLDNRIALTDALPKNASGFTSIGAGLHRAITLFENNSIKSQKRIFLITDGLENQQPYIMDVIDEVIAASVSVCTVAVGPQADLGLERLASLTNCSHTSHSDNSTELVLSFLQFGRSLNSTSHSPLEVVVSSTFITIASGDSFESSFYIDQALTGGLVVGIDYIYGTNSHHTIPNLISPSGAIFDIRSVFTTTYESFKHIEIATDEENAMTGYWHLHVSNNGPDESYSIVIQPKVLPGATPILVEAFWAVANITTERQSLYVTVSQGSIPVINANVTAIVTLNVKSNNEIKIYPRDDGAGADTVKNDGVYSTFFTQFVGRGRYGTQIIVSALNNTQLVSGMTVGAGGSPPRPFTNGTLQPQEVSYENTGNFERLVIADSFECNIASCDKISVDIYPPCRIVDLFVSQMNPENNTVTITFTAPGDDLSDGNALKYDIRYSTHISLLRENFERSPRLPHHWLVLGDASNPAPGGSPEVFVFNHNSEAPRKIFVAISAIDDVGHRGDRSNIVTLSRLLFSSPQPHTEPILTLNFTGSTPSLTLNNQFIIEIVVPLVICIGISGVVVTYICKTRHRSVNGKDTESGRLKGQQRPNGTEETQPVEQANFNISCVPITGSQESPDSIESEPTQQGRENGLNRDSDHIYNLQLGPVIRESRF